MQFLLLVKQEQNTKITGLDKQINQLKAEIASLQKIKQKSEVQENILKKELLRVGEFSMFGDQI